MPFEQTLDWIAAHTAKLQDAPQIGGTKPLPTDVGRISDMLFQVLKYDVFRNGAVGG